MQIFHVIIIPLGQVASYSNIKEILLLSYLQIYLVLLTEDRYNTSINSNYLDVPGIERQVILI